jgi:hypothetical protein
LRWRKTGSHALLESEAVKHLLAEHEIVRLETERKIFTDGVKMICYRAETCLFNLIAPFFARNNDEGRVFLKNVFQQPADIILDKERRIIISGYNVSHLQIFANQG